MRNSKTEGFGERLKSARRAAGLLQADVARLCGVKSAGVISQWETDTNRPSCDLLVSLADVLNVPATYLLLGCDEEYEPMTKDEYNLLLKYRALDERVKKAVSVVLDAYPLPVKEETELLERYRSLDKEAQKTVSATLRMISKT